MKRFSILSALLVSLVWAGLTPLGCGPVAAAEASRPRVNLLFLITDQQRFDALGCAGNPVVKTPNLDRLARQGVRFQKAYTACPVCVPARTSILTGHGIESTNVHANNEINRTDVPHWPTFDQVLLRSGYRGEYHGKYHSPYQFALDYSRPVRWCNGKRPPGCKADMSESQAFVSYIEANVPSRPLKPGELLANMYRRPYRPDPLDGAYGKSEAEVSQGTSYGCLDVPPEHTMVAWTAKEGLEALQRLRGGPFTLTISIGPPHPPMVLPRPYYGMYPAAAMRVPASIDDPRANSPYRDSADGKDSAYRDKDKVRQMVSDYYGLVTEVDDWIGRVLKRLDELGLAENTLVVFTSDHGEMLGDHGMHSKFVFYEGSAHIPLLMRLPGAIPAGTVVAAPVSHLDLYATILDYCGMTAPQSEGSSLRGLIDGKDGGAGRFVVSEWPALRVPGFMLFDGRWKLLFGRSADARSLDALYDLQSDPQEIDNLLGGNPNREKYRGQAERLKGLLVAWLERVKSPRREGVEARPAIVPGEGPAVRRASGKRLPKTKEGPAEE
jgi:arylsulfatase A-like enzyme